MKNSTTLLFAFGLALLLTGCFQHTYTIGAGAPDGELVYKQWHHHWLFGLIRPKLQDRVDVAKECSSDDATIHERVSFLNGVIDVLIGIIYSPTTVTITCGNGVEADVELSVEDIEETVGDARFLRAVEDLAPERLSEVEAALADRR